MWSHLSLLTWTLQNQRLLFSTFLWMVACGRGMWGILGSKMKTRVSGAVYGTQFLKRPIRCQCSSCSLALGLAAGAWEEFDQFDFLGPCQLLPPSSCIMVGQKKLPCLFSEITAVLLSSSDELGFGSKWITAYIIVGYALWMIVGHRD